MYAIIETGGKQIRVEKDAVIFVEKLEANEGDTVTFDKVLYADGKFGKPFVEGAKVTGVVEKQGKGKKITIVKYKAKKSSTRRKQGHRQPYTRVKIEATRDENGISLISMHGHAEYDQYGKDIVCSAASTIIIGGINAIAQLGYLSFISYNVVAGDVELKINNTESAELQIILNTLLVQFLSIEEEYPKYIQVQEV